MSQNTTSKERILQFIEYKGISKYKFYQETGISNGVLDKKSGLSMETVEKLLLKYPEISERWLLTGNGEMIKSNEAISEPKHEAVHTAAGVVKNIPIVSQFAQAGYLSGFSSKIYMEALPTMPFILPRETKSDDEFICFEVAGDSMTSEDNPNESILERDLLICRSVNPIYWQYKLHFKKWDFVIVHRTEGILVKRIIAHDVENNTITIHSLNPFYEDKQLHLKDIDQLFNVVMVNRAMKR